MNNRARIIVGLVIILIAVAVSFAAYTHSRSDKDYNDCSVGDDLVNKEYSDEELEEIEREYEENFEPNIIIEE